MMQKNKNGFSVIEILLILAIISLLMAIILVNFGTIKQNGDRSAVLTEVKTLTNALEECFLENSVMYCGGTESTPSSSSNCNGSPTAQPVSGTAICGVPGGDFSEKVWPVVEKNGYAYSGYGGSDANKGAYVFGLFPDTDGNGVSDSGQVTCCTSAGCAEFTTTDQQICRARARIVNED